MTTEPVSASPSRSEATYDRMPRRVVVAEIIDTHSGFRWGFIRGIMMGFIGGIRLEDHPLRPAKILVMAAFGGSAGIPDSLVHKPVDTSGRAGWSSLPCRLLSRLVHVSH